MKFLFTDIDRKMSLKLANFFGLRSDEYLPSVRIVEYQDNDFQRFSLSRNITKNSIVNFIQKWKDRELRSYKNYETFESDLNRQTKDSIVKKISFSSLFESVNFNRKSVVIFFYTDWCSVCKKVIIFIMQVFIVYEALTKRFNKELISFFTINLQNNENNNLGLNAVPALYLYPFKYIHIK